MAIYVLFGAQVVLALALVEELGYPASPRSRDSRPAFPGTTTTPVA